MAATPGQVSVKVTPDLTGLQALANLLALSAASGRLLQAVRYDTVAQMTNTEARAWITFTAALDRLGVGLSGPPNAVMAAGCIDPVAYVPEEG